MRILHLAKYYWPRSGGMERVVADLADGATAQVDVGAGLRVSLPFAGVLRLDYAHGLRDGADAWSVGWTR